jgi:carbamoyltransferase
MAIVDGSGQVLFAEASERRLRCKRAAGCAADSRAAVQHILSGNGTRPRYVIAKSWSRLASQALGLLDLLGLTSHERLSKYSGSMTRYLVDRQTAMKALWLQHTSSKLSGGYAAAALGAPGRSKVSHLNVSHHLAHAASGCYTSPFQRAACMVVDGHGEWGSVSYFEYRDGQIRLIERVRGAVSLGSIYAFCTDLCGFSSEEGEEWKLMGLAPYGSLNPAIYATLRSVVEVTGLRLRYPRGLSIQAWARSMRRWARPAGASPLAAADLAHTTQHFFSEVMSTLLTNLHARGISDNLVLAGGCALNSSFNGQIAGRSPFKQLHVPSAPADDGAALGAALVAYYRDHPSARPSPSFQSPYLGSSISQRSLQTLFELGRVPGLKHLPGTVHVAAARLLADGKLLGWIQGRAEFGPRALGNRSILADPRSPEMKERINARVKFRESFRPFAPSVLDEFGDEYFENYQPSRYMERTLTFRECARQKVPAVAHVNGTGRVQSVRREWNERFYDLIRAFHGISGVPILLNTSFNIMGQPIVHSLEDAIGLFYTTGLDALVIEDYLVEK